MENRSYLKEVDAVINQTDPGDYDRAVFIMQDQINMDVWPEWIRDEKPLLIFIESFQDQNELPFHKKRLIYLLSSMRHFTVECHKAGFPVYYQSVESHFEVELDQILDQYEDLNLWYMNPSEWGSRERLQELGDTYGDRISQIPNAFFFADPEEWKEKIEPGYRMEYFYRDMRKQTGYLMNGEEPEGGEWNFDEDNRESLPSGYDVPEPTLFKPDDLTREVIEMIEDKFPDHFGNSDNFRYAINRKQALQSLEEFIDVRLADFGPYEDAMASEEPLLFHSGLSPYMNNGLLLPWEICERAIEAYHKNEEVPINSVEGLVRQILGWREFVHIYYEAMMPEVRETNYMNFKESLPEMYWSGETQMNCMRESLKPVIEQGYSHHIQRLMVLSNFSNLTKTDPRNLNDWFRFAYVDAHEWVVLPNVLGMSTFADGGVLASKPYVSSGNYINKMSDYCKSCAYSISKKTGEKACPFNYLYWNFVDEQRDAFQESGRNSFMVNMYEKKSKEDKEAISNSTENFMEQLKRYKTSQKHS